jgi:hypothetical protein
MANLVTAAGRGWSLGRHAVKFACPYCGQMGEILWNDDGTGRHAVELSKGFQLEKDRLPDVRQVIICDLCDQIDPAGLQKL